MEKTNEIRYIVRIANRDLDGNLPIYRALTAIKGVSHRLGVMIASEFEKQHGIPLDAKLGTIAEEKDRELEKIIQNPAQYGIPEWVLNRRKNIDTGKSWHAVGAELDLELRKDLQRLSMIKSYRGLRHIWGLPVRGQRTKSTHRGKGPVVGVTKKEAKAAIAQKAAAKPSAGAAKKEEKEKK